MKKPVLRNVSLARALSKLGYASRTQAARLVGEGKVTLNGRVETNPDRRCSLEHDRIAVEQQTLREQPFIYLVMNKPPGYVTTRSDERGRKTVYDLLEGVKEYLFPVGRLDKETSGLLLFTNDHRLGERLTNPESKVPKTYHALLDRPLDPEHRRMMESGMMLDDERLLPAVIHSLPGAADHAIEITILEGKNRQIRRMLAAFGYDVRDLQRVRIGGYGLRGLKPGEWKYLSEKDIARLTAK